MTSTFKSAACEAAHASSTVDVRLSSPSDAKEWDHYVDQHPMGTFFHLYGWAAVSANAYGYEPLYLVARRGPKIVGVLPLLDVRSPLLGRSIISTAFTTGGGPIGDDDAILDALAEAAVALGRERRVKYVELRGDWKADPTWLVKSGKYATFNYHMPQDEAENLSLIPRRRRAQIRKAIKSANEGALQMRYDQDPDLFYRLYARALRNHGTPVFPKKFLTGLAQAFSTEVEISFVEFEGAPVATLLSFYYKDAMILYYAGSSPEAKAARANDYHYWSLMRRAVERGYTTLDFGRSKIGTGPYHFKTLWGIDPEPLSYQYKLITAQNMPDVNPNNPKFYYFTKAWQHLPLPVANTIGPLLAPNFP
ncbi:MAG: peptidoglycan bridge formation protein FemAB [Hyphococcus sp.]|nr:MAG: peptidoglycan bridge formation protein FemAB [Marinicaulis sp.]